MSSDIAICVTGLSKCYQIYDKPRDRLLQMICRGRRQFFREFWSLRDVSFEIGRGETVGIIGRNGSGKSTLLQLICGTLAPTAGSVVTHGRVAALLELGSGFNPEYTGRENIYLNCAIFGLSRADTDARMDDILAFADIGQFVDQPVKTYSSGMFVRLAFSVQVSLDPDILVVDEALAVGDALFQKRCYERIESLKSRGTTLLFVSHDEESVRTLTDRAILLREGRVVATGLSAEVLLEYRRQLHDQERNYLAHMARSLSEKAAALPVSPGPQVSGDRFSFGDAEAEVVKVSVLDRDGRECQVFSPLDVVVVEVVCMAHVALTNLNVSLRIRNKEGVKIYSWGTLNQDIHRASKGAGESFWRRSFCAGQRFVVRFEWVCGLGANLYELQAAITHEGKPYYAEQRMLHWRDEAAFFTVTTQPREYHFGGVVDLRMSAVESAHEH